MSVIGFDVGSENCYTATIKSGGIEILDNEYSLRSTPTYVAFTENSRDIGVSAKAKFITNLENTIFGFKRILGKKYGDFEAANEFTYLPYSVCELSSGDIGISVNYLKNNVVFSVEQIMAMILTKLKRNAEMKLDTLVGDCVIAVPVYYNDVQRRTVLNASKISGLNALKLVNESTAIALAYGYFKRDMTDQQYQNVVFVDIGYCSITVSLCTFLKDGFKVLGHVWDNVGGRDFDAVLVNYFINDFKERYNIDAAVHKKALMSLMLECESLKKMMSANSLEIRFCIESFIQDQDVQGKIKREIFENLSVDVLSRIEKTLCSILIETNLNPCDIHVVELVGGSSRIPAVKNLIRKVFDQDPNSTLNLDEAVARGCALQCAILSPLTKTRDFVIEDMPSYTVKIVWKNKECRVEELEIYSKDSQIPSFKMITFHISKPFTLTAFNVDSQSQYHKIACFSFANLTQDAEESESMKVQAKAFLNDHGIFSLVSAKRILKDEVKNSSSPLESLKDENNESSNTDGADKKCEGEAAKTPTKTIDLFITRDDVSGKNLEEFIKAEKQMINREIEENDKADARNALEEYIYDIRGKLSYEYRDFLMEEDREKLLRSLSDTQYWIYDDESQTAVKYHEKLSEYRSLCAPIVKRYVEWEERQALLGEYNEILQRAFDFCNNIKNIEKFKNILPEEVNSFYNEWQNYKQFRDQAVDSFSKMEKHHDAPLSLEDLRKSLTSLKNAFSDIEMKITLSQETSKQSGDGFSQDPTEVLSSPKSEDIKSDSSSQEN